MNLQEIIAYLGKQVRVRCCKGYLGTDDDIIEGNFDTIQASSCIKDDSEWSIYDSLSDICYSICISKTLCKPVDGDYTWIDLDFIESIEEIHK